MPYRIAKQGKKFCVENSDTGAKIHCHPSRGKAIAHLRALYANVSDAGKAFTTEAQRGYSLLSAGASTGFRDASGADILIGNILQFPGSEFPNSDGIMGQYEVLGGSDSGLRLRQLVTGDKLTLRFDSPIFRDAQQL